VNRQRGSSAADRHTQAPREIGQKTEDLKKRPLELILRGAFSILRAKPANRLQRHTNEPHQRATPTSHTSLTCSFRHRRGLYLLVPSFRSPFLTVSAGTRIEQLGPVGEQQKTLVRTHREGLYLLVPSPTGLIPARSVIDGAYTCSFRHFGAPF